MATPKATEYSTPVCNTISEIQGHWTPCGDIIRSNNKEIVITTKRKIRQ